MIQEFVQHRLKRFEGLVFDPSYGIDRAIKGLKGWKSSQSYRLTDKDNEKIALRIRWAECLLKKTKKSKK